MHNILVLGAGKIGSLITFLLCQSNSYNVYLADIHQSNPHTEKLDTLQNFTYVTLDAGDTKNISDFVKKNKIEAIVSSLPYYCNVPIAKIAAQHKIHYFDLTEDVETSR